MSRTGGGATGNTWFNISLGLDGSSVQQIITDPARGSHDAYAVTTTGVFYLADSVALANNPTNAALGWKNISGPTTTGGVPASNNVFGILHNIFGNSSFSETLLKPGPGESGLPNGGLTTIQADWRYVIPADPTKPVSATNPTHPVLYVGGGSNVFVSLDNGQTWSLFPNVSFNGSPADGGFLPDAQVTQLNVVLGNVDPTTGRAVQQPGDPNVLLATTYGRGDYAIRLAPIVFPNTATSPNSITLDPNKPAPNGSNNGTAPNGGPLVTTAQPFLDGFSEQSAFGNKVRITLLDLTDPLNPRYIGGFDGTFGDSTDNAANQTDAFGKFSVQINAGAFTSNGVKTIGIQATDASGTKGNIATFSFTLQAANLGQPTPPTPPTLALLASDDSSQGQNVTNVRQPHLVGTTSAGVTVQLLDINGNIVPIIDPNTGATVNSVTSDPITGAFSLQPATPLTGNPATQYSFRAKATNTFGSSFSPFVTFTVKTVGPASNTFIGLDPNSDTGVPKDNITTVRNPVFDGTTDPGALVDLINVATNTVLATATADASGKYAIQLPQDLNNGTITLETRAHDVAGNQGPTSAPVQVTITSTLGQYTPDTVNSSGASVSAASLALFRRTNASTLNWLINGVSTPPGIAFGQGGLDIPFAGDFNGDGINDLAVYEPSTAKWIIQLSQGANLQSGNIKTVQFQASASAIPIVGDFDGDGVTDVGLFDPTTGKWTINESTAGLQTFTFGRAGDIPVPGNYDGTGTDEPAVYRASTGQFLIDGAGGTLTNPTVITVGVPNEVPVPANYDNTFYFNNALPERTDPAVYDPTSGTFTIGRWSGTSTVTTRTDTGPAATPFRAGDIPAPGDYDGTGNAEPAVFRPSTGQYIVSGLTGATVPLVQANSGYTPVLAPYVYRQLPTATKVPTIALAPADDSGVAGDNITNVTRPHLIGTTDPNVLIDLVDTSTGAIIGTTTADGTGNYSVQPTNPLIDKTYKLQVRAHGLSGGATFSSSVLTLTIQTNLLVTSFTPGSGSLVTTLPNGQVTVTFNHPILGLVPNSPTQGFASNPFAVTLIPSGPDGGTQLANHLPLWSAPSGVDKGDLPVPATLLYQVNANGTSQITLTPAFPLATDIYLITVGGSGMTDVAGNPVSGPGGATGTVYASFDFHASPATTSPLQVVGVTASHGSVVINNNQVPQPDTIAIQFNRALDPWTANGNNVQLLAQTGSTYTPVTAAVAYSPSTNSIYLTPEAILSPGTVYVVAVGASVSDDQNFPNPGTTLGQAFYTTFTVSGSPPANQSPLTVTATSPADHTQWTSPLGYVSATFSEALNTGANLGQSLLSRFSAMLIPQTGGVTTGGSGYADVPMNAKVAFNPNTNQLVIVPTQLLGNQIYLISLNNIKAQNGDTLSGGQAFRTFQLTGGAAAAHTMARSSQAAPDVAITAGSTTTTTAAVSTSAAATTIPTPAPAGRGRPAQKHTVHDHALSGAGFNLRSLLSGRRKALASAMEHVASAGKHGA